MQTRVIGAALAACIMGSSAAPAIAGDVRYRVEALPSLGGGSSVGYSVNDRGWIAGRSNLPGNQTRHATLWRGGVLRDLGTLGGPNSAVLWPVKNVRGVIAGVSQTNEPDRSGERWSCAAFFPAATATGYRCLGFRWEDGEMTPLPTLGGFHGFATGANNRGEIAGWAENRVLDPTCEPPQRYQFRAVVWGPRRHDVRQLRPLAGDSVSSATALNDRGQVVGISGDCDQAVGRLSAKRMVLWQHGRATDIGGLGGVAWNTPMSITRRGDIVGFANASAASGAEFDPRAFVRLRRGPVRSLGTLPGDATSQGLGINERREAVGTSCDADGLCKAFRWRRGQMQDLNSIADKPETLLLTTANDIADDGRITGQAYDAALGQYVAFEAVKLRSGDAAGGRPAAP